MAEKEKGQVMASVQAAEVAEVAEIVEAAVDSATVEEANIPNSSTISESVLDKYKKAFASDGFDILI